MKMAKDMFNPEMMKKYSEVGVKVQALQTELASTEVECTTADGSVTIKVSGTQAPAGVTVTDALCATGAEAASATLTQALKDAQTALGLPTKLFIINSKAIQIDELYGVLDPATRDWTDGVLSNLFRDMNQPLPAGKENEKRWMIFDGDVDALWIENMNSVMGSTTRSASSSP